MDSISAAYAKDQDAQDVLNHLRAQFLIPTRAQLKRKSLKNSSDITSGTDHESSTYLCGNSLGLQPRLTAEYTAAYHQTWATKGVYGHFTEIDDSPLVPWLHVDDDALPDMSAIVGAQPNEVAVMQTLTANLHFAMATFYRPTKERYKIILESKAFPSDHYAVESQILHHKLDPSSAMITIEPPSPAQAIISTSHILCVIDEHASTTALLLLPGIQFYTGQFFDIPTITSYAQARGIAVGWDLAHAIGNVPLQMHDWNVDFAAWCSYKYLNCGPGSIGGLFIHERHSQLSSQPSSSTDDQRKAAAAYKPRLSGWWGSSKSSRFAMANAFEPIPGAAGWQLSNPSVADLTALRASLDVFKQTSMAELRAKSRRLTGYLEELLDGLAKQQVQEDGREASFEIITPRHPDERGAQLSVRLASGFLDSVMKRLEEEGVVVDERRPDVIRVAPAPLYNSFSDVLRFVQVFRQACKMAKKGKAGGEGSLMVDGGNEAKGWSEIK